MSKRRSSLGLSFRWLLAALLATAPEVGGPLSARAEPAGPGLESTALARPVPSQSTLFERVDAARSGVDFAHRFHLDEHSVHLLDNGMVGGGLTLGDYDGDGRPDLFLTRPHGGNRLYRNLGDFRFEDATRAAGIPGDDPWGTGASFADVDGDGDLDLYVCSYDRPNRLYVNRGDGTFEERAAAAGLDFRGASVMMAFADYDRDGDLDGYLVTNYLYPGPELQRAEERFKHACEVERRCDVPPELRELRTVLFRPNGSPIKAVKAGQADRLYRNEGDGTFTDVTREAGIRGEDFGLSATWWDYDGDGLPDLYVANDFHGGDQLLRNRGDGTFVDVAKSALPHTPWFSMGTDSGDINNDGRLDFIGTDMSSTSHYKAKLSMGDMEKQGWFLNYPEPRQYMRNAVYLGTGTGRFMEVAQLAGLSSTDWTWSPKFGDLDNDGRLDLFVSNGMTRQWFNSDLRRRAQEVRDRGGDDSPLWMDSPRRDEANLAFRNLGDLRFESVGAAWGLDHVGVSFGAGLADLDGDGDLDLAVNHFQEPIGLYRNGSIAGHRVLLRLRGTRSNRHGLGARVELWSGSGQQLRYHTMARGFASTNDEVLHFGLGESASVDRLAIHWPGGAVQEFRELPADRFYTAVEPSEPAGAATAGPRRPLFERSAVLRGIRHRERPFDDYALQPLLPNKLSQLGPGMAWGDVDGDGDEDLYVGGAAGRRGGLYLREGDGFQRRRGRFHADSEDMAPLFFDADGDGDLDLYVVSGGVEVEPGDPTLRDRLYWNDGAGGFTAARDGVLPDLRDSGSIAAAADFDRDGDLDLFVGGRSVPGAYPLTPNSRLLRNQGGRFEDASDERAPGLRTTGLVTGAVWSDADGDGWVDLLVTHEWEAVKLWRNEAGHLVDRTAEAGLAERRGWYHGIAARDVDDDGDIDYAVTNMGLNTKYGAPRPEHPVRLFYGSFDGSDRMRLVEATEEHDTLFPVRGKSCSTGAIPALGERFPTFHDFAQASLQEIYSEETLDRAFSLEASSLESGVLLNDGSGRFDFAPLPRLAQAAPGFGVVLTDFDADGRVDLYLSQNFFSPQPETGRFDGGTSLLLRGRGDGRFDPVWPDESGIVAPGDGKGVATADLDDDGWVDVVVASNDGEVLGFENRARGRDGNRALAVRLVGPAGNRDAVGARVTLRLADGTARTAEVHAGSSYLSQSSATLHFGLGREGRPAQIEVRWPGGRTSRSPLPEDADRGALRAGDGEVRYRITPAR